MVVGSPAGKVVTVVVKVKVVAVSVVAVAVVCVVTSVTRDISNRFKSMPKCEVRTVLVCGSVACCSNTKKVSQPILECRGL